MKRKLNNLEKRWLDLMMEASFDWKDIIIEQLSNAYVVETEITRSFALVKLVTDVEDKYPNMNVVPVTMLVHVSDDKGTRPIQFLLHVVNGFVNELEIFDSEGIEILNYEQIPLTNIEYLT